MPQKSKDELMPLQSLKNLKHLDLAHMVVYDEGLLGHCAVLFNGR